jgi:alpha-L-arabinofuranosidase
MTFDIFNRHAEKIEMANVAQTINCLHSLFLAQEDKYVRTPPYYVFEMYRPHMNGRLVPMRAKVADLTVTVPQGSAKMAGLSGSASIQDKRLTVTLTNPSLDTPVAARIRLAGGARSREGRGVALTHSEMRAANTFQDPNKVVSSALPVKVVGDVAEVTLPKQAVAAVELVII